MTNPGIKIKLLRRQKRISQRELARVCGISSAYMCQIEKGDRNLGLDILVKIATVLNVTLEHIIDFDPLQKQVRVLITCPTCNGTGSVWKIPETAEEEAVS